MDVMLDFETKGLVPGYGLLSMGAVRFDRHTGDILGVFYRNLVDHRPSQPSTQKWWDSQPKEARQLLSVDQVPLFEALGDFASWYKPSDYLWAHGAAFDPPHLEAAYHHLGFKFPVNHRMVLDTRTVYHLLGTTPQPPVVKTIEGFLRVEDLVKHYALDDCYYQVAQLVEALKNHD